eukprot:TRINITY_DN1383_c0_g3_i2.p1 TRINITY_DN1383_c0_g3~~TRINITY_DN1383_c0_g3_i2.p1  ORF type:complete len:193 (-),score=74.45 TRINITY_DN1383_c0_g3_i2:816-1394(-)
MSSFMRFFLNSDNVPENEIDGLQQPFKDEGQATTEERVSGEKEKETKSAQDTAKEAIRDREILEQREREKQREGQQRVVIERSENITPNITTDELFTLMRSIPNNGKSEQMDHFLVKIIELLTQQSKRICNLETDNAKLKLAISTLNYNFVQKCSLLENELNATKSKLMYETRELREKLGLMEQAKENLRLR